MAEATPARRESALLLAVPEAEPVVGAWRRRHDPSAALGVPAHITLLYPFRSPARLDAAVRADLRAYFAAIPRFRFTLATLARFPAALYLAPEPGAPFRRVIGELARRYPDAPPYGGAFARVVPHLTVAHSDDPRVLDQVASALAGFAPIEAFAREVGLMVEGDDARWRLHTRFPLGGAGRSRAD
jgi:2'-5' RNA ligase